MTDEATTRLKQELSRFGERVMRRGLAVGPGGNISARDHDRMWISPSGYALDEIEPELWAAVEIETGKPLGDGPRPSSESPIHLAIYRVRPDVQTIVHTHPPITIGIIAAGYDEIPFMFPDHVAIAGTVPCIEYVVPGSPELAAAVVNALRDPQHNGLYLRNHGLITLGQTLKEAYYRTEVIEDAAKVFWIARSVGTPSILSAGDAAAILDLEAERYRQQLLREAVAP